MALQRNNFKWGIKHSSKKCFFPFFARSLRSFILMQNCGILCIPLQIYGILCKPHANLCLNIFPLWILALLCILYIVFCSQLSLNFPRVECIMSEITGQNIIFKYASCSQKFSVWICMNLSFVKVIVKDQIKSILFIYAETWY